LFYSGVHGGRVSPYRCIFSLFLAFIFAFHGLELLGVFAI
jgi:hypothetical protein